MACSNLFIDFASLIFESVFCCLSYVVYLSRAMKFILNMVSESALKRHEGGNYPRGIWKPVLSIFTLLVDFAQVNIRLPNLGSSDALEISSFVKV